MATKTKSKIELPTLNPAWLIAKADAKAAASAVTVAENRLSRMGDQNERHVVEVAKAKSARLITNGRAELYGSGSGYDVIYSRCSDGPECEHDPREQPFSRKDIAASQKAIDKATTANAKAQTKLLTTSPDYDAFAAARSEGASHVWWPMDREVDPRLRRWQGKALTDDDIVALGPHELHRNVINGSIIEVPA